MRREGPIGRANQEEEGWPRDPGDRYQVPPHIPGPVYHRRTDCDTWSRASKNVPLHPPSQISAPPRAGRRQAAAHGSH